MVSTGLLIALAVAAPPVGEKRSEESIAIGLLRAVTSAEISHFDRHGRFATLDCLVQRSNRGGPLLNPIVARLEPHAGYRFEFHHDGKGTQESGRGRCSAPISAFAIVATPATLHGSRYRSFCADERKIIYVTPSGAPPRVDGARCADTSTPLQ